MKKTLLGLLFSAALIATSGLTASAADTPQTSNGTVGFTGGDITIDNGDTDLAGASLRRYPLWTYGERLLVGIYV